VVKGEVCEALETLAVEMNDEGAARFVLHFLSVHFADGKSLKVFEPSRHTQNKTRALCKIQYLHRAGPEKFCGNKRNLHGDCRLRRVSVVVVSRHVKGVFPVSCSKVVIGNRPRPILGISMSNCPWASFIVNS
jgi:hypothetical protein